MLSELALQDLTSADRTVFATQLLEAQRLIQSALAALANIEPEVVPPSNTRRRKRQSGSKTSVDPAPNAEHRRKPSVPPASPQQLLERLRTVAEQVSAIEPRDAQKAWSLATEVRQIRDGLGRFGPKRES